MSLRILVRSCTILGAAVALLSSAWAGNPAAVKVGDWVSYKMSAGGGLGDFTLKRTATARDARDATLKVEAKFGEKEMPGREQKVPLKDLLDPAKTMQMARKAGVKADVKKLESGKEEITVDGKKYKCEWQKIQTKTEFAGKA